MSIAVSTVVEPSRLLLVLLGSLAIGISYVAYLVGAGHVANLSMVWRLLLALGLSGIPFLAIYRTICCRKSLHIDISGNGQITVEEDNALDAGSRHAYQGQVKRSSELVRLLPSSTIWPYLLLLRLQREDRSIQNVLVFPDCMSINSFRALSVACRWIAAHNDRAKR